MSSDTTLVQAGQWDVLRSARQSNAGEIQRCRRSGVIGISERFKIIGVVVFWKLALHWNGIVALPTRREVCSVCALPRRTGPGVWSFWSFRVPCNHIDADTQVENRCSSWCMRSLGGLTCPMYIYELSCEFHGVYPA